MPRNQPSATSNRAAGFIETYLELRRESGERILSRSRMTMASVVPFLGRITIVELRDDQEWRVSLNGTMHCIHANRDRTGQNALSTCDPAEIALRQALAAQMFARPCGVRAEIREDFDDGQSAVLDSVSLPLYGKAGQRIIATCAEIIEDIPDPYGPRPTLTCLTMTGYRFIDLGYGIPEPRESFGVPESVADELPSAGSCQDEVPVF